MTSAIVAASHVVVFTIGAWGHIRPMCAFVSRMVRVKAVHVTFIVLEAVLEKALKEISRHFAAEESNLRSLIRFLPIEKGDPLNPEGVRADFTRVYEQILASGHPHPNVFISEITAYVTHEVVRKLSQKHITVVGWCPLALSVVHIATQRMAKEIEPIVAMLQEQATEKGITFGQAADKMYMDSIVGSILEYPDFPPVSDYELFPQEPPAIVPFGELTIYCLRTLMSCDAVLTATSSIIEPNTCDAFASFLGERDAQLFPVGPVFSAAPRSLNDAGEFEQSDTPMEIKAFLERTLKERGQHSILYISFGSVFSPIDQEQVWAFIEVVISLNIPFLLVHPPRNPELPAHIREVFKEGGLGQACQWAPQQYILSHPAIGWFLTHNGINSTLESLTAGVPMICWPINSDQPMLAILVSQTLHCGYELSQVRHGHGLQHRASIGLTPVGTIDAVKQEAHEVLNRAFFQEAGRRVREEGSRKYKELLQGAWDEGVDGAGQGVARQALGRFIDTYIK